MRTIKPYLGLDVHKDSISLAVAPAGCADEIRLYGTVTHDLPALERVLARLRQTHPGARLQFAAPGELFQYWLHATRRLR